MIGTNMKLQKITAEMKKSIEEKENRAKALKKENRLKNKALKGKKPVPAGTLIDPNGNPVSTNKINPYHLCGVALDAKKRWPAAEPIILEDIGAAHLYATEIIKGRWPELEKAILKSNDSSLAWWGIRYVEEIMKTRWPELEKKILSSPKIPMASNGSAYAQAIIKGRWPEFEAAMEAIKSSDQDFSIAGAVLSYAAAVIGGRWPGCEHLMLCDSYIAYRYVADVVKHPWPEAEPIIMQNAYSASYYAEHILKRRWIEAEDIICSDSYYASLYKAMLDRMGVLPPLAAVVMNGKCDNGILGILSLSKNELVEGHDPSNSDIVFLFGEGNVPYITDGEYIYDMEGKFVKPINPATKGKLTRYLKK